MSANRGAEVLHICTFVICAEWVVDEGGNGGQELRVEFIDRRKGVPDPPNGGERFDEVLLYSEYLQPFKFSERCGTRPRIRTLGKENPLWSLHLGSQQANAYELVNLATRTGYCVGRRQASL